MDIVLLLGGRGERMGSVTRDIPKFLLSVDGQPILIHLLDQIAASFGAARVILATGFRGELVRTKLGMHYRQLSLHYVNDERHLETRHRILSAESLIGGPFVVIGSDVLAHASLYTRLCERLEWGRRHGAIGAIGAANSHEPTHGHALVTIKNGWVEGYAHHPPEQWGASDCRDMHAYAFDKSFLQILKQAPSDHVWVERVIIWSIANGHRFAGEVYTRRWYHFAEPRDLNTEISFS